MGGTGRFSGEVFKDPNQQEAVALPIEEENELANDSRGPSRIGTTNANGFDINNPASSMSFVDETSHNGTGPFAGQNNDQDDQDDDGTFEDAFEQHADNLSDEETDGQDFHDEDDPMVASED